MNRVLLIALVLILGSLGVRWLVRAVVSDETKIRWVVEEMAEGFNEAQAGQAVSGLARDWTHAGRPVDREMLRGYLFKESMEARDRTTKRYRWKVEVPEETLVITPTGKTATLELEASFSYLEKDGMGELAWEQRWRIRLEAELVDGDDGWKLVRSSHEDLQGVMLGR